MFLKLKTISILILLLLGCKSSSTKVKVNSKSELVGKWEVVESTLIPFQHISFCDTLGIGSVFHFKKDGSLKVFNKQENVNCNGNQFYKFDSIKIRIQEWDMLFNYEVDKLINDTLIFRVKRIPKYIYDDSMDVEIISETDISDTNLYSKIKKEGIEVKLIKGDDD